MFYLACKYCSHFDKNEIMNIQCNQTILPANYDSATPRLCSFGEIIQLLKKMYFSSEKQDGVF